MSQITTISQTTFSNAFSWKKTVAFWFQFHWMLFVMCHWDTVNIVQGNDVAPNRPPKYDSDCTSKSPRNETLTWQGDRQQSAIYMQPTYNKLTDIDHQTDEFIPIRGIVRIFWYNHLYKIEQRIPRIQLVCSRFVILLPFGRCRFYPYPSGLLHCHRSNHMIAPIPVKQTLKDMGKC